MTLYCSLIHPPTHPSAAPTHLGGEGPQAAKQDLGRLHAFLGFQPPQANLPVVHLRGFRHGWFGGVSGWVGGWVGGWVEMRNASEERRLGSMWDG